MKILHWVYIMQDSEKQLSVGITPDTSSTLSLYTNTDRLMLYLRAIAIPFDAMAHKHLLEDLSLQTLRDMIRRNEKQTEAWIGILKTIEQEKLNNSKT